MWIVMSASERYSRKEVCWLVHYLWTRERAAFTFYKGVAELVVVPKNLYTS
jgi:hypothetical protein